jgi:hypothetical protein
MRLPVTPKTWPWYTTTPTIPTRGIVAKPIHTSSSATSPTKSGAERITRCASRVKLSPGVVHEKLRTASRSPSRYGRSSATLPSDDQSNYFWNRRREGTFTTFVVATIPSTTALRASENAASDLFLALLDVAFMISPCHSF